MNDIENLARKEILELKPYSSARGAINEKGLVYLDANENPFGNRLNRYPDPLQDVLKKRIGAVKNIPQENLFLGNGSDEILDLIIRVFCRPGIDNMATIDPSYGMYEVLAQINNVEVRKAPLSKNFEFQPGEFLSMCDENTRVAILSLKPGDWLGSGWGMQ